MRLLVIVAAIGAIGFGSISQTHAGERFNRWWAKCKYEFHMNSIWPDPYILPERAVTRAPFDIMVAKGWQEQNTLTEDHFVPGEATLSETGRIKVADVLINSPPQYRTVFIEKSWTGNLTAERMAAVQEYVAEAMPELSPVAVAETMRKRPGISAEYTNQVLEQWQSTQPAPRLPAGTVSGTENDN
jgi:hypothetical protein